MTSALWMRWLDFRRLRDLARIVNSADCILRAKDLAAKGMETGILIGDDGAPFKPTTVYHYRRTMERLGVVRIVKGRYCVARDNPMIAQLTSDSQPGQSLDAAQKRAFATLVLNNDDCYGGFLKIFVSPGSRPRHADEFVQAGGPVLLSTEKADDALLIRLRNIEHQTEMSLSGESATQAVLWGMKPWCVEQLQFLDELFSVGLGYVLYPRLIDVSWSVDEVGHKLVELLEFTSDWTTIRVEELILKAGAKWKLPAQSIRVAILWLNRHFPDLVATIATSEQFVLSGLHPTQRRAAMNSYVRLPSGEFVSHLRVHSTLVNILNSRRPV